jgi:hypothetical protein
MILVAFVYGLNLLSLNECRYTIQDKTSLSQLKNDGQAQQERKKREKENQKRGKHSFN